MNADRRYAIVGSVVVHLLLLGILALTLWERPPPPAVAVNAPIIQARAVDEATALEPVRRREAEQQRQREEAELQRKEAEAAKRRQAEEQQQKAEAEKQRQAAEQQKKAEAEKKRQVAEQQKKAEAEKKRLAAEQQKKAEAEKKRLAEEQQKKAEAEKKRLAEEQKKKAEAELQRKMEAEAARIAEEARQASAQQRAGRVNQYLAAITNKVTNSWLRQPGMPQNFVCKVWLRQIESGVVTDVRIIESSGNIVLDRSVEAAVWKASPLPPPPSADVFDREIVITFVPK